MSMRICRLRHGTDDEGSVVLALLAIMVLSGLLLVVAAVALSGQKQTRSDQRFEEALEVAEVGLAQMNSLVAGSPAPYTSTFPTVTGTTPDGGTYSATAVKDNYVWKVASTSTTKLGKTRTVQNDLSLRPLFSLAAYGKTSVTFNGGNGTDSFDSQLATSTNICVGGSASVYADPGTPTNAFTASTSTDVNMCNRTSLGVVATDGELNLKGGVADRIDGAEIYNAKDHVVDPLPGATGTCIGVTATCDLYNTGKLRYLREPVPLPPITSCTGFASAPVNYTGGVQTFGGRAYNLANATLTGSTVFTGTVAQPTILCVSGTLTVQTQNLINFEPRTDAFGTRYVPRRPGTLLIFVTSATNSGVVMGNNASISGAIYAPNAAVDCGPQGNVYGSIIANGINNGGGWNFHYDDSLRDQMANAAIKVSNWAEKR